MYQTTSIKTDTVKFANISMPKRHLRVAMPILLIILYSFAPSFRTNFLSTIADAYINVGVFVALTLFIYYTAEKVFGFDISKLKTKPAWQQISIASILGALPGCGGAIIVVSQYAAGHISFSSFVAVLIATMGDAAFLILAKSPKVGMLVILTGIIVGVISGLIVDKIHGSDFLKQNTCSNEAAIKNEQPEILPVPHYQAFLWLLLLIVATPFTLLSAFQVEVAPISLFGYQAELPLLIGVAAAVLSISMWSLLPLKFSYKSLVAEDSVANKSENKLVKAKNHANQCHTKTSSFIQMTAKVVHDTNFIMVWVIIAFLLFEVFIHFTGFSLEGLFTGNKAGFLWLAPLLGVVIGFLPGCGPQIIVASLYLQGVVPISTLLGNAISNDGDALFPALALAPKAAIIATAYSAIPALIVAYCVQYFF